jgi:hypothetical protein
MSNKQHGAHLILRRQSGYPGWGTHKYQAMEDKPGGNRHRRRAKAKLDRKEKRK